MHTRGRISAQQGRRRLGFGQFFKAVAAAAPRCPVFVENLEPRRLLSAANITGTTLNYIASASEINTLSITLAAGTYTISDSAGVTITAGAGVAGGGSAGVPVTASSA